MKIRSLQISNILSFKYYNSLTDAEVVIFEDGLNIIIGENGAGKSTALEIINFIFKRILCKQYNTNQDSYSGRENLKHEEKQKILSAINTQSYSHFRLDPNWDTPDDPQKIRLVIALDEIDLQNIKHIQDNITKLNAIASSYTTKTITNNTTVQSEYVFDISLNKDTGKFTVTLVDGSQDFGFEYLSDYNFYKELISLHNLEHPEDLLTSIYDSFTLISSYRNYHAFTNSISLKDQHPIQQIQTIKTKDFSKSLNENDQTEPSIFSLVRLQIAEKHFNLISQKLTEAECETKANNLDFILSINKKLQVVNLECKIKLIDLRTWQYSFEFFDIRRKKVLANINSLSAGQKAIIHLVFEAYGRGNLKGGLVIIDEPEIHLHYQFQNEYLQVVRDLNKEQGCQYILVTHSEALINSSTINQVKRFSLNSSGNTEIKAPTLSTDQRILIKILDNTRSTYAFFAKKVLLVEGDTDRYFFKSIIQEKYPELDQQIAILYMGGKGGYNEWSKLFESFGLLVYCIGDLDFAIERFYPAEKGIGLRSSTEITAFKLRNTNWETKINTEYTKKIYILKNGDLEHYLGIKKGLPETIEFCNKKLTTYLTEDTNAESKEIREIIKQIVN
ncbi:MAG: AAA family ATPase [Candidatus Nomurabacteria bacterium]|nr:AAA family ATPase [Candidatus Nomurabacteria bacterium]